MRCIYRHLLESASIHNRAVMVLVLINDRILGSFWLTETIFWYFSFCAQLKLSLPAIGKLITFLSHCYFCNKCPFKVNQSFLEE